MDLDTICGSSNTSFKRQQPNNVQDVLIKWKKRKISAVRDFPVGCGGRYKRTTLHRLKEPVKAETTTNGLKDPVEAEVMENGLSDHLNAEVKANGAEVTDNGLKDHLKAKVMANEPKHHLKPEVMANRPKQHLKVEVTANGSNHRLKGEVTANRQNDSLKVEVTANGLNDQLKANGQNDPVKAEITATQLLDSVKAEITAHRLTYPVEPEVQGLTEALMAESIQKEGDYLPKALDDNRLWSLSKVVSSEVKALTEKAMARSSVRIYPPRRRISAIRTYPKGYPKGFILGGKATEGCKDIEQDSLACKVNIIEHNASCSVNGSQEKKAVKQILPRLYPPRRKFSAIRTFPEGCGGNIPKSSNGFAKEAITIKT